MKILTHIEGVAETVPVPSPTALAEPMTLEEAIKVLAEGKILAIEILKFIEFFTSTNTDAKIDKIIAALNALPSQAP